MCPFFPLKKWLDHGLVGMVSSRRFCLIADGIGANE
jgi:hypothetical protein